MSVWDETCCKVQLQSQPLRVPVPWYSPTKLFLKTFKSVICTACHTATTVVARKGKTWRLRKEGKKDLNLSWGKLFFIIRLYKKVCVMYTTNGIITEVVECHECSNHRRSEMKYSSINKRLFVSVGWKGELVFRHCYFCKEANRRHIERQIFFIVIQIFRVASLSTLASNDIADSSVSLLSLLSSAVVSYQRVFLQPF